MLAALAHKTITQARYYETKDPQFRKLFLIVMLPGLD